MPSPHIEPGFDFLDPDRNVVRLPIDELAELRTTAPVWWCEQKIGKGGFNDGGYWVVTKHKDVKEVSRRSDVYLSGPNTALPQFADDMTREDIDMQSVVLLNMDGERHDRLRRIISRGFTPRAVERLRDELTQRAENIVKTAAAEGTGDFVEQVSCELPLQVIAGLLGVPQDERAKLFRWTNEMTGNEDPEFAHVDGRASSVEVLMYAMQLAAIKANEPGDDIVTAGFDIAKTVRYRNIGANTRAAVVIDDLAALDPWTPRGIKVRGRVRIEGDGGGQRFRISPEVIWSWGVNDPGEGIPKMERREVTS